MPGVSKQPWADAREQMSGQNVFWIFDTVYCPVTLLWCNDIINVLAGPLKHSLAVLVYIFHSTSYTTACNSVYTTHA